MKMKAIRTKMVNAINTLGMKNPSINIALSTM